MNVIVDSHEFRQCWTINMCARAREQTMLTCPPHRRHIHFGCVGISPSIFLGSIPDFEVCWISSEAKHCDIGCRSQGTITESITCIQLLEKQEGLVYLWRLFEICWSDAYQSFDQKWISLGARRTSCMMHHGCIAYS